MDVEGLGKDKADLMVENCIGTIEIPLGVALNFVINHKKYLVPMAIEEPSVIAAASNAAKIISENSYGFIAKASNTIVRG
jgi:degradative hydroxymethylglutaryl-CoA reductase